MCDSPQSRVFSPLMRFYLKVAYSAYLFSYESLSYGNSLPDFITFLHLRLWLKRRIPIRSYLSGIKNKVSAAWEAADSHVLNSGIDRAVFYKRQSCLIKWQAQNIKYWGWMRIWTSEYLFRRRAAHLRMFDRPRSRLVSRYCVFIPRVA